jgi:ABC-type antimicrobial peptide transport system permease subunit
MGQPETFPPKYALRFFRWYCHPTLLPAIEGDLLELYQERVRLSGKRKADVNFLADVVLLFRPKIIRPVEGHQTLNQYGMLKSYFKIGWRNLLKTKGYSLINIGGLAIGMAAAILIGLWLHYELTFNQNFTKYDRIARVIQNQDINGTIETWFSQAKQLGPQLRDNYGANFKHVVVGTFPNGSKLTNGTKSTRVTGNFMDPGITEMLDLKVLKGTRNGLQDRHSIMLNASAAKALFGDENPIDKTVMINDKNEVKVTAVYEDLPVNCGFADLGFISPFELAEKELLPDWLSWGNSWFQVFVELEDGVDMKTASENIRDSKLKALVGPNADDTKFNPVIFLHPMERWYLHSDYENGVSTGEGVRYVWMFGTIGLSVLLLACINFMNLSTARAERRAKEVGIRKTVGSRRPQLVKQFYIESFIVVCLALVLSIVLAQLVLPWFNMVSGRNLSIPWSSPVFWLSIAGFSVFVGFISGSYPALYLSSFKPVKALRGGVKASRFSSLPRKIMVVVQFSVSVILIVGTFVIIQQINFAQNRPLGYDNKGLISSPIRNNSIKEHYDAFSNDLRATGAIKEVALTDVEITNTGTTNGGIAWPGKPSDMQDQFWTVRTTPELGKLLNWQLVDGRDFLPTDTACFIVNETAARHMDMKSPVGTMMTWGKNGNFRIIGVVKDMITISPYTPVTQMIFVKPRAMNWMNVVNMKLNPEMNVVDALSKIEAVFKKHDPENAFEYSFADQKYANKFSNERRVAKLSSGLAGLGVFICCLGLLGLASYMAEQRTKEIGIRKVLGASIGGLWRMMSRDFVLLVVIAGLVALPPAYFIADDWLSQFEYRVPLSWFIFAASVGGALVIALLTVSYHALRSALANPVNSLRSE